MTYENSIFFVYLQVKICCCMVTVWSFNIQRLPLLDAPFQSWSWCTWFYWWSAQPKQFPQRRRPMSTGVRPSLPWWSCWLLHRIPWRKLRTRCWSHPLSTQPRTRGRWAAFPRGLSRPQRALRRRLWISRRRPRHDTECLKMTRLGQAFLVEWSSL